MISLEPRPLYCDRGSFVAKLYAIGALAGDLDGQDGWPRYYFSRERAMLEIRAWLEKRGQLLCEGESAPALSTFGITQPPEPEPEPPDLGDNELTT